METLYPDKVTEDDENGLPVYYRSGSVITKEERWTTDQSAGPDGTPETEGAVHRIARLPFGAYILQEEQVPYGQGYVQPRTWESSCGIPGKCRSISFPTNYQNSVFQGGRADAEGNSGGGDDPLPCGGGY